jgi:hypothetical protein
MSHFLMDSKWGKQQLCRLLTNFPDKNRNNKGDCNLFATIIQVIPWRYLLPVGFGLLLHHVYKQIFYNDKKCLQQTLAAFAQTPEEFPDGAKAVLQAAQTNFTMMAPKEITETCHKLRSLTKKKFQEYELH